MSAEGFSQVGGDMSSVETDVQNSFFYCLYYLPLANPAALVSSSSASASSDPSTNTTSSEDGAAVNTEETRSTSMSSTSAAAIVTAPTMGKLEVKLSSLDPESEQKLTLRKYITQRVERNLIYESGSLGIFPMLISKHKVSGSTSCFYAAINLPIALPTAQLVAGNTTSETSNTNNTQKPNASAPKLRFVLCLITLLDNEGFSLFRNDLERFSRQFGHLLHVYCALNGPTGALNLPNVPLESPRVYLPQLEFTLTETHLRDYLASWPTLSIDYLSRAITCIENDLDVFLHATLIGKAMKVTVPNPRAEDILRLAEAIHITSESYNVSMRWSSEKVSLQNPTELVQFLTAHIGTGSDGTSTVQTEPLHDQLVIDWSADGQPIFSTKETNEFCRVWAQKLRALVKSGTDSLKLRAAIEQTKVQVNQELNHVKRLVDLATIDNYALYEAYLYIKNNPNRDVLLVRLLKDTHNDANTREVLEVIYDYLTDSRVIQVEAGS